LGPSPGDVGTLLLAGVQAFFETDPFVLEEVPRAKNQKVGLESQDCPSILF
jgi:hypothetical protein